MATIALLLTQDHAFLLLSIFAIAVQCFFTGFIAGGSRSKAFNKDFMERNFGEIHFKTFGVNPPQGGYPDMGNGRYAERLDYKEWYDFNNRQRAHYNFIEHIVAVIPFLLIGGIALPIATGILGWVYFVGRIAYTLGYVRGGPKGRLIGALTTDVAILGMWVTSVISIVRIYKGTL